LTAKPVHVLLVDDEQDIISVLKPNYYDIVVSDIKMPVMNGFQLCRKIRERDARVRLYFLSAFDIYAKEAEIMFPTLGSKVFIKKPIRYGELATILMQSS
jgi:YesN/AraC family two-component response regulator